MLIKQAPTNAFRLGLEKQGLQVFENAEVTTEIPLKNGKIMYDLTPEEKEKVEAHYGMTLDDPANVQEWIDRVHINIRATIDTLDITNPEDILKVGVLKANKSLAPNLEEAKANQMAGYKWVLYTEAQEDGAKLSVHKRYHNTIQELLKLSKKRTKLLAVAKYILPSSLGIRNDETKAYVKLTEWLEGKVETITKDAAITKLNEVINMDEHQLFVTVDYKEAVSKNIIRRNADGYFYNTISQTAYGKNQSECIKFLTNPKNQDELGLNDKDDKDYSIRYQLNKYN